MNNLCRKLEHAKLKLFFFFIVFRGGFGDSDWMSQGLDFDGGQSDEVEKERKSDARLTS